MSESLHILPEDHPDNGGSEEEFRRVCEAKEALLE